MAQNNVDPRYRAADPADAIQDLGVAQRLIAGMHDRRVGEVLANPALGKAWLTEELRISLKRFPEAIPPATARRSSTTGATVSTPAASGDLQALRTALALHLQNSGRFAAVRVIADAGPSASLLPCRCVHGVPEHTCTLPGPVGDLLVTYPVAEGGTCDCIVFLANGMDGTGFPRFAALAAAEYYATEPQGTKTPEMLLLVATHSDSRGDLPGIVALSVTPYIEAAEVDSNSAPLARFGPRRVTSVSFQDTPSHSVAKALPEVVPAPVGQRPTARLLRLMERPRDPHGHEECDMNAISQWAAEQARHANTTRPPPPDPEIERSNSPVAKIDPNVPAPLPALAGTPKPTPTRVVTVDKSKTPTTPAPAGGDGSPGRRRSLQMC